MRHSSPCTNGKAGLFVKILHIVHLLAQGGIEQLVLTLLEADLDNTYVVVIEGSAETSIAAWPILEKYQSRIAFADIQKTGGRAVIRLIRKICMTHSITALHSHYSAPLLYAFLGSLGLKKISHVHTEHDAWHLEKFKNRLIESLVFSLSKKVQPVAISRSVQQALEKYFPAQKTVLIRNAVNTDFYKPGDKNLARQFFNFPTQVILAGSVGRLQAIKGHRYLIEAMRSLRIPFILPLPAPENCNRSY